MRHLCCAMMTKLNTFPWKWALLILACAFQQINGATIHMESSGNFVPLLTPSTRLRCSLNSSASADAIVGRRDVRAADDNVHIATISITRGQGQDVASITTYSKARGFVDADRMNTTGSITNDQGYLEVVWTYPTLAEAADYKCEISGFSDTGHVVKFTKNLSLDAVAPSMDTLVQALHELKVENDALKEKVELCSSSCGNNNPNPSSGSLNLNQLQSTVNSLQVQNEALKLQFNDFVSKMQSTLDNVQHIEHGVFECQNDDVSVDDEVVDSINFTKKYDKPPIVYVAMYGAELNFKAGHVTKPDYFVEVDENSVTTEGFDVICFLAEEVFNSGMLFYSYIVFPRP